MKRTINSLTSSIEAYSALSNPLSIDPTLDGGLKKDILQTLNNKATSVPYLKLFATPASSLPPNAVGVDGDYFIVVGTVYLLFVKGDGTWNAVDKSNDMLFYCDGADGVRRYYSFSDDLTTAVKIHELDMQAPEGAVKVTPQTFTTSQKTQARANIDAASQSYIDNAILALKNGGAVGATVAGSIMPWAGTEASIPADWAVIGTVQKWYSKTNYLDLYNALGGENNVWGLTGTTFSIPYSPNGSFFAKAGNEFSFPVGSTGGEASVLLSENNLPAHVHSVKDAYYPESTSPSYNHGQGVGGSVSGSFVVSAMSEMSGGTKTIRGSGDTDANNGYIDYYQHDSESAGGGIAHNNMPPFTSLLWIIKLKNTGVDPAETDDIVEIKHYKANPLTTNTVTVYAGDFIKNVYMKKASGSPVVQISDTSGQLIDTETAIESVVCQSLDKYYLANDALIITVTNGTINILITKLNL